ncbi:MAG: PQQ-binding-like beta-propeller repeat protein [Lentisphaeraceae bacterium]|nr:PQQ-binding-like beta-propeller repeat protein [Lentisphaeraceae bacterium]
MTCFKNLLSLSFFTIICIFSPALEALDCNTENWPSHMGPNNNYNMTSAAKIPIQWSVSQNHNIKWRVTLPEPGTGDIAVWADRLFFTCFRKLSEKDIKKGKMLVSETVAYCLDSRTGMLLWTAELPGKRANLVNGLFNDSTTPAPVTDGKHVWFVNAGGYMACYSVNGKKVWGKEFEVRTKHSAKQFQPFLFNGGLYYAAMRHKKDPLRRPQKAKDYDKNSSADKWPWMFVLRFNALTGATEGLIEDGISVHSKAALGLLNGDMVILHGKGGGHKPPETPYGLTLSKLNGERLWNKPGLDLEGTHYIDKKHAYSYSKTGLRLIDLQTGKTLKTISLNKNFIFRKFNTQSNSYIEIQKLPTLKNPITHRSSIGYKNYQYFMSYMPGVLGRVNIDNDLVEYLQVPLQVSYNNGRKTFSWDKHLACDVSASGVKITGDKRSLGHGFGHVSAATPIIVNDKIYFTTMLGTVYVIDASAEKFDSTALLSVNDLGAAGQTWTLSSFSCAQGKLYQRTMREIICIDEK